jgi:nucleoside phosphorylase
MIHWGTMASGDTVMKCAMNRDAIARHRNIIGFEMEGAGVCDSFPSVIVKGACDYADSHKSQKWQNYAAITAACAMKALIQWYPRTDQRHGADVSTGGHALIYKTQARQSAM